MNLGTIERARNDIWCHYIQMLGKKWCFLSPSVRYSKTSDSLVIKARCGSVPLGDPLHLPFDMVVRGDLEIIDMLRQHSALVLNLLALLDSVTEQ